MEYSERILKPLPDGLAHIVRRLSEKPTVKNVEVISDQIIKVFRKGFKNDLLIYVVDAYSLGDGDTYEIISKHPDIDAILLLSNWNEYSSKAKALAKERKVGLFTYNEMMGAIYYFGEKFINYQPKE